MILFLNERDVLNKWQQQDSTCDVCMYNLASGVSFCGINFCFFFFFAGTVLANRGKKLQKSQILEPAKIY